jgi:hypothetical protein
MEARATYYHVLLRAVKDDRARYRPVVADADVRWREVSNEGFKNESDAKESAELMALAYVRKRQPETTWQRLKQVEWRQIAGNSLCDFCDRPAQVDLPDASGIPVRLCTEHTIAAAS